jgi:prophage antirepressor-like protein
VNIVPYTFPKTGSPVRVVSVDGEPWFVATDVCAVLEIGNPRQAVSYLDDDEVQQEPVTTNDGSGRVLLTNIVSEPGLYSLILRSRKPQARAFKRWITHDVIPAIRRTGQYEAAPQVPQSLPEALRAYADEVEAHQETRARVAELEPAAHSWNVLADAAGDYSLRDAAHILNRDPNITTGQNRLMTTLRELEMIDRKGVPYARHSTHLTERLRSYEHPHTGEAVLGRPQIRVTVAGLQYLHKRLGGVAPLRFLQLPLDGAA